MTDDSNKKRLVADAMVDRYVELYCTPKKVKIGPQETLPYECRLLVSEHVNTIYVGSMVRLFSNETEEYSSIGIAHWSSERGIYFTMLEEKIMKYYDIQLFKWVVNNNKVYPGAYVLARRDKTDDIHASLTSKSDNEQVKWNTKTLWNDVLYHFPTKKDQYTYKCMRYRMTYECNVPKKAVKYYKEYQESDSFRSVYYACQDRGNSNSCSFFVWDYEISHGHCKLCKCDRLVKITSKNKFNGNTTGVQMNSHVFICPCSSNIKCDFVEGVDL